MKTRIQRHTLAGTVTAIGLGILAACTSSTTGGTITASDYNQSCTQASDCVPIISGPIGCCSDCPDDAINKSDEAKYMADLQAATPDCHGTAACPEIACLGGVAACLAHKCVLKPWVPDGGPGDSAGGDSAGSDGAADTGGDGGHVACGAATCAEGEVCVMDQFEGGPLHPPNDAGMCPDGDVLLGSSCEPAPSYRCVKEPASCTTGGLSCSCAQSLCQSGYTCKSAKDGEVSCYLLAP